MKAVQFEKPGDVDVLHVVDVPTPQPRPGDVLVKVAAAGVNYADTLQRKGNYPTPAALPFTMGSEVAGVVESVGPGVTTLQPGQRIAARIDQGGYAEYALVPADRAIVLPDGVGFPEATALLVQGPTAVGLLRTGHYDTVLVLAATGGVGSMLVQIAKNQGKRVIAAVGSAAKKEQATELGADAVVSYADTDWVDQVLNATNGAGVSAAFDAVGGAVGAGALQALGKGGTLVVYGAASGTPTTLAGQQLIGNVQAVRGYTLYADQDKQGEFSDELFGYVQTGKLKLPVQTFPLAEVQAAHRAMESRQTQGKVVLVI